jgi:penicillin-binding protein 1A
MSNTKSTKTKKPKTKNKFLKALKITIITLVCIGIIGAATGIGIIMAVIQDVPEIDYTKVATSLNENSVILDEEGQLIEKIQAVEFRTIVDISQIPEQVQNAFIAIEDERFRTHNGFDLKRIFGALWADIKARQVVQGASTITQQLVKNLYLFDEVDKHNLVNDVKRKIREVYLAIEMDKNLSKDQILNAYLNTVNLGRGAYGVQAAAELYFDKDVSELTLVETAMLAAVPKSPTAYSPYILLKPEDVEETHVVLGSVNVLGTNYTAIVNKENIKRRKTVLITMLNNKFITREQYDEALAQDPADIIKITKKINANIETSYFNDYVKDQVTKDLMKEKGYTKKQAGDLIRKGGLTIYSTMDIGMQSNLEGIYDQFTDLILKATHKTRASIKGAVLVNRNNRINNNIADSRNKIIYYEQPQLYNKDYELIIDKGDYSIDDSGNLIITSPKVNYRNFDTAAHYIIDGDKNLLTFAAGYIQNLEWSPSESTPKIKILKSDRENKRVIVSNRFLNFTDDYYRIDTNGNLLLNPKYLVVNKNGIVQPQSSTIIMDYRTGKIKALVGGRDIEGQKLYNRATSARQPGSSLKPLSVYLPALDSGLTAASTMDDIPYYTASGKRWPANWYGTRTAAKDDNYRGINTLREAVQQSINVSAVKYLEYIGIPTSIQYLGKLHLIDTENPSNDSFISAKEAQAKGSGVFDENLSALALGGMSHGISPLRMTAGYGAIANNGEYIEPIAYTKVLDRHGKVLLEKTPTSNIVTSPQVAYIMSDILESVISKGIGTAAAIYPRNTTIPVAGKTGTTQNKSDAWFVGYTPYYVSATWIGNDSPAIKLSEGSKLAANLWRIVMKEMHKDLPAKGFDKPSGLTTVAVCKDSGLLPNELCSRAISGSTVYNEIFIKGTEPKEKCNIHVEVPIDTTTNKLATLMTPMEFIEKKVVIKREPPYNPDDHNGFMPRDYQYSYDAFVPDDGVLLPNDEVIDPNTMPVTPGTDNSLMPDEAPSGPSEPPAWLFGPSDDASSSDE